MKNRIVSILLTVFLMTLLLPSAKGLAAKKVKGLSVKVRVDTFNMDSEAKVRSGSGKLADNEFYAYVIRLKNSTDSPIKLEKPFVTVDKGEHWGWTDLTVQPGKTIDIHIYNVNMRKLQPGTHEIRFYANDKRIFTGLAELPRDWNSILKLPSSGKIKNNNNSENGGLSSPYVSGWIQAPGAHYTEYSVECKADYLAKCTYLCAGNWYLDFSELKKQYGYANIDQILSGYGGLQVLKDGSTASIMSMWNIDCMDDSGNIVRTIVPKQVYPEVPDGNDSFDNEGVGVHHIEKCGFEKGRWYRFSLECTYPDENTTRITQWITDLSTNEKTKTAAYEIPCGNICFKGDIAIFLENFGPAYAGNIRTAEYRNPKIKETDGTWKKLNEIVWNVRNASSTISYHGSCVYGSDENVFYVITTGVGKTRRGKDGDRSYISAE